MLALMSHRLIVSCVFFIGKERKKYSNFIIGRQRKNTPYPVLCHGEFQTVPVWLTDPANLPTNRGPSEFLPDRVPDTDEFLRVRPLVNLVCYDKSTRICAYKQV